MPTLDLVLADENATLNFGAKLARALMPGMVIYLHGDLGAGKTTLARGILRGLQYAGKVKSPTYNLVEVYNIFNLTLYHFDLYRFKNALEWEDSGFADYCSANSLCLIEWPEKALPLLPAAALEIRLTEQDRTEQETARHIQLRALNDKGTSCLQRLSAD